jgi:hypothetical protein
MNIDLLNLQPNEVSKSLEGYSVLFYGAPKSGKTTIATKFPKNLLLGFEKGYNALPGIMVQPINSWSDFNKVLRQLKDPAAKEKFSTIIIDTGDIAYEYAEKYVCDNYPNSDGTFGVDKIGDIPYGGGYAQVSQMFDKALRSIVQMDYGLVIISHSEDKTFKDEYGNEYNKIVPTLPKKCSKVVLRLVDIVGYSRVVETQEGQETKLFLRGTPRFEAGSRFKYTPDYIDFNYDSLVGAIADAVKKEQEENDGKFVSDEKVNNYSEKAKVTIDELKEEFNEIVKKVFEKLGQDKGAVKVTSVIEEHLGKGGKVAGLQEHQTESLTIIIDDLKELL